MFSNIIIYLPPAIHYLLQRSQIVVRIHLLFVATFSNIIIYLRRPFIICCNCASDN